MEDIALSIEGYEIDNPLVSSVGDNIERVKRFAEGAIERVKTYRVRRSAVFAFAATMILLCALSPRQDLRPCVQGRGTRGSRAGLATWRR